MDARMGKPEIRTVNNPEFNKNEYLSALGLMKIALNGTSPVKKHIKTSASGKGTSSGKGIFGAIGDKFAQQMGILFADDDGTMQ